jgi:hypothetical protein
LYIKDLNFAYFLINDNSLFTVTLAKINFQTQVITSQTVFPKIKLISFSGGVFINEALYFIGARDFYFY